MKEEEICLKRVSNKGLMSSMYDVLQLNNNNKTDLTMSQGLD